MKHGPINIEQFLIIIAQFPQIIAQISNELNYIKMLLQEKSNNNSQEVVQWFTIDELRNYLPGNPAKATIYGKVHNREIPHKKVGKRLAFLKSEIDQWLKAQGRKTASKIEEEANLLIQSKR